MKYLAVQVIERVSGGALAHINQIAMEQAEHRAPGSQLARWMMLPGLRPKRMARAGRVAQAAADGLHTLQGR